MSQFVKPGDFVNVSLEGQTGRYIVKEVETPLIYIYPENDPSHLSAIELTPTGWKVKEAEDVPYQISFVPSEEEVADICVDLILRRVREIDERSLSKLQMYTQEKGFPEITKDFRSLREGCDFIFRDIFTRRFPEIRIERLSLQNLARQYESEKRELAKEEARRKEELTKEEARRKRELVEATKKQIRAEEIQQVKDRYKGQKLCTNIPRLKLSLFLLIEESLVGRRVSLPLEYMQTLFDPFAGINLSENVKIQQMYYNLFREFPEGLSNQDIIERMGEDKVRKILRMPETPGQIHAKISINDNVAYALITETHEEEYLVRVSPRLASELGMPQESVTVEDCTLELLASIDLKMFRPAQIPSVGSEEIKAELINIFSELGVPVVGDILLVTIGENTLTYFIEKLITVTGKEVYAAAIPPVPEDIEMTLRIESKEELLEKLRARIPDVNEDLV